MKTLLWKEWRENAKWAALAFLGLLLAEIYTLSSQRQQSSDNYTDLTICSSGFLLVSAFGCAAAGAALAALQILPELRRDRWAALLHRPVSRGAIFLGKAVAGLALYLGAVGLPFAASVAYVAVPGQFAAPLVPGMLLPGLNDLAFGAAVYLAALLLCLHRGRWPGSRGAAGAAVAALFALHLTTMWPWLLAAACAAVFGLAARSALLGNGPAQDGPWLGRLAFFLVVFAGTEALLLLAVWGLRWLPAAPTANDAPFRSFEITRDDQVFVSSQRGDGSAEVLTDAGGQPVSDPRYTGNNRGVAYCQLLPLCWDFRRGGTPMTAFIGLHPRGAWNYARVVGRSEGKEAWYLLVRQNYFVGYDKLSRRVVGICDADGFRPAGAVPRPFRFPVQSGSNFFDGTCLFWSGARLYAIDFTARDRVTISLPGETIYGALPLQESYRQDRPQHLAVALRHEIRLYDPRGALTTSIPYARSPEEWTDLSMAGSAANRFYVQYSPATASRWLASAKRPPADRPVFLDAVDPGGKLIASHHIPADTFADPGPFWTQRVAILASPLLLAAAGTWPLRDVFLTAPSETDFPGTPPPFPLVAPEASPAEWWMLGGVAVVLAVAAWLVARGLGLARARAWTWALVAFGGGLPGFLTYWLVAGVPARARCPHCGRQRPLGTELCPRCWQPWPSPEPTGTEIFSREEALSPR